MRWWLLCMGLVGLLVAGCAAPSLKELAGDHSAVCVRLGTPWGQQSVVRLNPSTDWKGAIAINPDCSVMIRGE